MRPFDRKSERQGFLDTVDDSLQALSGGLTKDRALKAGLVAGALAALTAASAGISSLRRRSGAGDDS
jgi:hypothetical protein